MKKSLNGLVCLGPNSPWRYQFHSFSHFRCIFPSNLDSLPCQILSVSEAYRIKSYAEIFNELVMFHFSFQMYYQIPAHCLNVGRGIRTLVLLNKWGNNAGFCAIFVTRKFDLGKIFHDQRELWCKHDDKDYSCLMAEIASERAFSNRIIHRTVCKLSDRTNIICFRTKKQDI